MTHFTNLTNLTRTFVSLTLVDHAKTKHSSSPTRLWKYLTALVMVLCIGVGNAWGTDATFTMSSIFDGSNLSASVSSPVNATVSTTTSKGNADDGNLGSDGNYFQVILTDNTFSAASINGYINTTDQSKNWAFQFSTDGGSTWGSEVTQANDGTKSAHDISVGVSIPSGANGFRVIRRAGTSTKVFSITLTLAASARTFKSGQTIFFKDAEGGNIGTLDKIWVSDGGDVYAYFYDDAPTPNGAFSETVRSLVLHEYGNGGAIYKFIVPQLGGVNHEWTGVYFTRGNSDNKCWNRTQDQEPSKGKNLFTISKDNPDGSGKYKGDWSVYANGAAIVGDMNDWIPDGGEFYYGGGTTGTVYVDLAADTEYEFKVLDGTGWKGCDATISNTTTSWYNFTGSESKNCKLQTGEAGNYAFKYDNSNSTNKWLGVYYPQARLAKNKYIYFDASNLASNRWNEAAFSVKFVFKPYDNSSYEEYSVNSSYSNVLEDHVYYAVVPDDDYLGFVRVDRWATDFSGTRWNYADDAAAYERTSSKQNCMMTKDADKGEWDGLDQEWKIYCPPTTSETFTDNSTSVIAGTSGDGTSGNPYLVPTTGTIKVQASASKAVADGNMTINYDFKEGVTSKQTGTGTTYSLGSLSNNTTYTMSVDVYTVYNLDDSENSTKHTPTALYYKALNVYTISYNKGSNGTGDNTTAEKIYGISKTLLGVTFTRTGYTQTAWNTDPSGTGGTSYSLSGSYTGNADVTLYPTWTANPISVTLAKGDHGAANQSATINYDATTYASFTAVTPNTGYRCTGYYDGDTQVLDKDGAFAADNVTGYITSGKWTKADNCTLTAHWTEQSYSITYKDEDDETFSGTHVDSPSTHPTTHTYNTATSLNRATKEGFAFAGWYTTSGCTGDAVTSISASTAEPTTLYARWVELDLHEPGVYEKPEDLDGYGRPLKHATVSAVEHDYEVYFMTQDTVDAANHGALYAGPKEKKISLGKEMFKGAAANTEITGDGWLAFNMASSRGGSSSARIGSAASGSEFFIADGDNSDGAKDSRYAEIVSGNYIRFRVSGYDQFSFYGGDYNEDDLFIVKIDGITKSYTHNSSGNRNIFRFDISTGEHFIEITAKGTGSHYCQMRAFSLRLPDVTRYTVSAEENNDSYGAVDVTSISNVRTGSTLYVDENTFTVNGTTVTATAESGYRFDNWTIGGVEVSTTVTISAATTVTANFAELYTLSYDANGGTGSMSDKVGDGTVTLDANTFTKTGYIFAGWATSQANANAGTIAYADEASYTFSDDATLYAVWYKIIYEFTPATSGDAPAIDATISSSTGGKMTYTPTDGTTTGAIGYNAKGLHFQTTGKCAVTVDLDTDMDGGDIIVATLVSSTNGSNRGLKLTTTASDASVQDWKWSPAAADEERTYKYTITESGTFDGADEFRIIRITDAYLTTLKVARFVADFELTWNFNGGGSTETEGDDYTASGSVESGTTLDYPSNSSMSKPGYKFNGWSSTPTTMPASNLTLTAQWESFSLPNVSDLDVDDGATLSSIPLSWTIPGICDLSKPKAPSHNAIGTIDNIEYLSTATRDSVTVEGDAPKWEQFGVGFDIPATTGIEWFSFDFYGNGLSSDVVLWGGLNDASNSYWEKDKTIKPLADKTWYNSGNLIPSDRFWHAADISTPMSQSITQVAIYLNSENYNNNDQSFSVRNVRYGISGQNDIDHIVLMRKEGSAATGPADASATKLYEGTRSHYTDASDVTGKAYYYTVFAVHSNGAVSTGETVNLTLYTITYSAGANGSGTVAAGKKTGGIDFTLSSSKFTRDGYTQDGWSTSDGGDKVYDLGDTYSTDAALTLYPHWAVVSGPVITNGNPANGSIAITSDGSTPILSAVTGTTVYVEATPNTGYSFTSWDVYNTDDDETKVSLDTDDDEDGKTRTFTMPSYAVTVTTTFSANTYTVTLNGNGGSGNTANVTATYGSSSFSSSITNPTKTGYIFDGWYSGSGGTGTLIISSAGVLQNSTTYSDGSGNWTNDGAVTLYAKWTRDIKTVGWGQPWGGTSIPSNTTSTVSGVTLNATGITKGSVWTKESYNLGNGDAITINLPDGYYISAVSTSAFIDRYIDGVNTSTNELYIQFNSESTYDNSSYDLDEPIQLAGGCYDTWGTLGSATPASVSSIPSGSQSAKIFCSGNHGSGGYLYRIIVEITAYDCTPSTVSFNGGDATLGTAPLSRIVCGSLTLPGSGSLVNPGYLFNKWNDGEDDYDIGDSYDVTEDVTFTAQWVEDNTSLRIPGSVVTLNNGNDARMTGSDNSTIDIDGDGNTDSGMYLKDGSAEWDVYITPGVYNIKTTCCVNSYGIHAKVSLIDPAGLEDPVEIYNTTHISGSSGVYIRKSETVKKDFSSLTANKRYVVKIEDVWGDGGCHLYVKDIVFYPFRSITKSATNGTITTQVSGNDVTTATEGTTIDIVATPSIGYEFSNWTITNTSTSEDVTSTLLGVNSTIASTSFTMPAYAVTVTGTFSQIGYTIIHSDATNGSYTIKVGDASAVSANTTGNYNQTVALAATPSSGYVIDGWNVTGATVGNNNIASTSFTMPAGNVTVAPTFKLMPNVYYYQDGTRYASSTYKAPDGSTASSGDNQTINSGNEWTVSNSISGLTVSAKGCKYDGKSGSEIHETAYLKVPKDGDASDAYVKFVVAAGYKATSLKIKIGGYSKDPTVTLKPYTTSLGDAISYTGTVGGVATTENNFNEISWSNLTAGTYYLNVSSQNAYISEITAQTEQVGYTVSFAVDGGSTGYGTVSPSSVASVPHGSTVSISENVLTLNGTDVTATPTAASDEYTYAFDSWSVSDGASITSAQTITASFTRTEKEYTLTWDLDGGKVSTAGTEAAVDETAPSGTVAYNTALTAPVVTKSGYDFAGWSPSVDDNMPAANTTYTATWAERFTVTYNAMTGSVDPTSATGSTASKVTLPTPTKSGYDFLGWYTTDGTRVGGAGDKYGPTAAITLYAKWKGECESDGVSVAFTSSNKNDAGDNFANMSTSSNTTQMVGDGTAKLIAIGDAKLNDAGNKIGYRDDGRLNVVFKFSETTTLDIYFNANATSKTFQLSSFSSDKDLEDIGTSDYSGETSIVSSGITVTGAAFSSSGNTTSAGAGSASSGVITLTTAGGIKVTYSSLAAGCYVFQADGSGNEGYLYGYDLNGGASPCYHVTYHGNNATSGYVNDPAQYAAGSSVNAKYNSALGGFERTGYEFVEWNTAADGSGDAYKPFARITSSIDDDINLYAQWRIVIDADNTDFADKDDPTQYRDVKVTNGATLTLTQNTAVRDIIVETGSTLNVSTNGGSAITLATRSLSLVGGLATIGGKEKYDMPRVFVNSASKITKTVKTINFDIAVDNRNFYPIAVPFPVTVSDVDYVDATLKYYSNYGTSGQYVIKTYDGQKRANADMSNCWRVMRDGVMHYETSSGEASEVMVPGRGYILRALPASGYGDYAVIRFPMKNVDDEWTNGGEKGSITVEVDEKEVTTTKNAVSVVAYTNNSGGDTKTSNKGWNILGVPYMSCFVSSEMDADPSDAYLKGLLNITTGEYKEGDANIYVTIPKYDFSEYDQLNITEAKLLPGWCFFVQMDKDATLAFDKVGERASAPFRATTYEHMPTVKTGIILSSETASDKTTFLISDKYSAAEYEINADLEKMFGENGYTLATYSLSGETRLAYNAMSRTDATNVIPIGYRAPAEGEYTFAINPRYAENGDFERIDLIDYETGFVTNLLQSSYTFTSDRTQSDSRFALNVVPQKETPTDIEPVSGDGEPVTGARKVIINDKLYIILNGKMYDAKGVMVK